MRNDPLQDRGVTGAYVEIWQASSYASTKATEYIFALLILTYNLTYLCFLCSLVVNVMQRDSIPSEVDYETRQGVYSICLQLARWLKTLPNSHRGLLLLRLHTLILPVIPDFSWLVRVCLLRWMMMSSGTARHCHPDRFVTPDAQGGSSLSVELQRRPPTDRCLCLSGRL